MSKLLFVFLSIAFALTAFADPRKDKSHPCAKDFPLHCQNEAPKDENYWDCLGKKMNILSEQCSGFMKENVYMKLNDCGKEILAFCPGSKMNYGNWTLCLKERKPDLSNKCSRMINKIEKRYKLRLEVVTVCKKDFEKHCKNPDPKQCVPQIRVMDPSKLTPECKATVSELNSLL